MSLSRGLGFRLVLVPALAIGGFATLLGSACGHALDAGQYGTFRFIGRVKGLAPLAVLPPVSDRIGNLYTLYGNADLPEVAAFVSRAAGGSAEACTLTKGDVHGVHGWVGFADDRAWYWSGDALVRVPAAAACAQVLNVDPQTNADLQFRAVMPWVRVTSTRSSLVALIQSPTDRAPFSALIDLDRNIASNVVPLPGNADKVAVLGVGAEEDGPSRVVLVAKTVGTATAMQAVFYDDEANLVATAAVTGPVPPEYGVLGTLQLADNGVVVGLTSLGSLVVFSTSGGTTVPVDPAIVPVGVHRWDGALWLVGTVQNAPIVCALDDHGNPGPPLPWTASQAAANALAGSLDVLDDRSFPARATTWTSVTTAIGASPFLSAQSPWPHAPRTTLWVVAGPSDPANGRPITSIAIAPVGIAYP